MTRNSQMFSFVRWLIAPLALAMIAGSALAADEGRDRGVRYHFSDDLFAAGPEVRMNESGVEDLFAAGETVTIDSEVRETAHAAGRQVRVNRAVGENLYAAGYDVEIDAPIGEDVIAAGYRVEISPNASVARDVLAAGRFVTVRGPVAGDVSLAGRTVEIAGPISGSAEIRAREIRFADGARIDGTLTYWSREAVDVPANVIAPDRVRANIVGGGEFAFAGWIALFISLLVVMLGLIVLFAFLFRDRLVQTRQMVMSRPWRDLLLGIIATSALFGSILVLAVSLIGIPLIPLIVILIPFAILAGYLTTAHAIGALMIARARAAPGSGWAALGAILLGVLVLAVASAIPLLGWVIAVFAVIIGMGAWFALMLPHRESAAAPP